MTAPRVLVAKFGGSIVGRGDRLALAARMVADRPASLAVVFASAPGDLTDALLDVLARGAVPPDGVEAAQVLARAEHLGAELMTAALRSRGVPARALLPGDPSWPLVLAGPGTNAAVDLARTEAAFVRLQERSPPGTVWVLPGFVGVDAEGRAGTLARGGGDTSAVVAARCLGADRVYLVKDVPGVLSDDPQRDPGARTIPRLSRAEMEGIAARGAAVVARDALRYLSPGLELHVLEVGAPLDGSHGTVVADPAHGGTVPPSGGTRAPPLPAWPAR